MTTVQGKSKRIISELERKSDQRSIKGTLPIEKISVIMMLSLGPPPPLLLASWQLMVIPGLEEWQVYTCRYMWQDMYM